MLHSQRLLQKMSNNYTQQDLVDPEFAAQNLHVWLIFYGVRSYLKKKGKMFKVLRFNIKFLTVELKVDICVY